jgi:hypothetical protein
LSLLLRSLLHPLASNTLAKPRPACRSSAAAAASVQLAAAAAACCWCSWPGGHRPPVAKLSPSTGARSPGGAAATAPAASELPASPIEPALILLCC